MASADFLRLAIEPLFLFLSLSSLFLSDASFSSDGSRFGCRDRNSVTWRKKYALNFRKPNFLTSSYRIILTHSSPLIKPSFTRSKWIMVEICGLKFHLLYVHTYITKNNWNPSMRKEGHFYYWIRNFVQKSSFLWSKKGFPHGGISK